MNINYERPNIIIIICDHLTQRAIGAYGSSHNVTPTIDALAKNGIAFSNAYTTTPLCCPARASFWTGQYPHTTKVLSNGTLCEHPKIPKNMPTLGETFKNAGYETKHFGKTHDQGALHGFKKYLSIPKKVKTDPTWPVFNGTKIDRNTRKKSVKFLNKKHKKPFLMVCDFHNPHDICGWVGNNQGKHKDISLPEKKILPKLPDNFEVEDMEKRPLPIQYLCCSHRRLSQAAHWTNENYRHYLAAYNHYTNRVDNEIKSVIDALKNSNAAKNTLIVLMADHGDGITSHRMVTKQTSFYEEITRIPLIFSGEIVRKKNELIKEPLVSLLDLFPTLCEVAEITIPENLPGISQAPHIFGENPNKSHNYVVSEWYSEWCYIKSPGRMIRTKKYKYTKYLEGNGEELFDLEKDPGETRTLIDEPKYLDVLNEHRNILDKHIKESMDPFYNYKVKVDPRWRSHEIGYQHHNGSCASVIEGNK